MSETVPALAHVSPRLRDWGGTFVPRCPENSNHQPPFNQQAASVVVDQSTVTRRRLILDGMSGGNRS